MKRYVPKPKNVFYVYEHWRPDKDLPFYVGKGKGKRAWGNRSHNNFWKKVVAKLSKLGMCVEVRLVSSGLLEDQAFALEIERIALWRSLGVVLTNATDGGEGMAGYTPSEKTLRKMRKYQSNRPESHLKNLSTAFKDKPLCEEHCKALSKAALRRAPATVEAHVNMKASQQKRRKENPVLDETRVKTSESIAAWHARRRAAGVPYSKHKTHKKHKFAPRGKNRLASVDIL